MIVAVRFRDSVNVQGLGQLMSVTSESVHVEERASKLVIWPNGKPTLVTKVPEGNVLWMHEAPDPEPVDPPEWATELNAALKASPAAKVPKKK